MLTTQGIHNPNTDEHPFSHNNAGLAEKEICYLYILFDETHIDRLAEKAMGDSAFATNPRNATFDEMKELIRDSVLKGR